MKLLFLLLSILFVTPFGFGKNNSDDYCLIKLFRTGVVAIFPDKGQIRFMCKIPKSKNYSVMGFNKIDNLQVITSRDRAPYSRWYNSLLYVNIQSGEIQQFSPEKFNLHSSAVFSSPVKKDIVAIMLWKYPTFEKYWVLYDLKDGTILNKDYHPKNNGGVIFNRTPVLKQWEESWHNRKLIGILFMASQTEYLSKVVKMSRYGSCVLLVENPCAYKQRHAIHDKQETSVEEFYAIPADNISRRAFLLNSGPHVREEDDRLVANLTDYSFLIKGFSLDASFSLIDASKIEDKPDCFEEILNTASVSPEGEQRTSDEALEEIESWLRRGTNLAWDRKFPFEDSVDTLSRIISKELKQNSRCYYLDITIPFEYSTLGRKYEFPVRIRFIVDKAKPETQEELYSPVAWFTLTKGETRSSPEKLQ